MKPRLRVVFADDELLSRKRIARLLEAMPDVEVVGACESGEALLALAAREDVDVALLDVRMGGLSGLEARALLPEDGPLVIFTTAHAEHAVSAFEIGAVDYLLKPIEAGRLRRALDRAAALLGGAFGPPERLALATRAGVLLLDPRRVSHAVLDGELVTVHSADEGAVLTDLTLQELGARLLPQGFLRVHRRALLNLSMVRRLEPLPNGGFVARTEAGAEVPVSRQAARRLRRRLGLLS